MLRGEIRWRLAGWYGGVFALAMGLMGLAGYALVADGQYRSVDRQLRRTALVLQSEWAAGRALEPRNAHSEVQAVVRGYDAAGRMSATTHPWLELPPGDPAALLAAGGAVGAGEGAGLERAAAWLGRTLRLNGAKPIPGGATLATVVQGGQRWRVFVLRVSGPSAPGGYLEVLAPLGRLDADLAAAGRSLAAGGAGALALMLLVGWAIADRALRPVTRLTAAARAVAEQGDLGRRVEEPPGRDELAGLARTFNAMMAGLEGSQRRLRVAVEAADLGLWEYDPQTQTVCWAGRHAELLGLPQDTRSTPLAALARLLVAPEDAGRIQACLAQAVADGRPYEIEYAVRRPDTGQVRWLLTRGQAAAGRVIGATLDVTGRREALERTVAATEAARRAAAQLEALFDNLPVGIALFDRELRYRAINAELAAINGLAAGEHLGRRLEEVIPGAAPLLRPRIEEVFASGQPLVGVELSGPADKRQPGGRATRHVLASWFPVRLGGEVALVGAAVLDITERKEAEQAVRQSEERFRRVVESRPVGVIFGDEAGRVSDANPALLEMLGYAREELIGRPWAELTPPEYRDVDAWATQELLSKGSVAPYEKAYRRKDGGRAEVLIGATLLEGQRREVVGFAVDITERKRADRELRRSEERFRALVQASAQLVWTTDAAGFNREPQPDWLEFTGQTWAQEQGWGWLEAVHPDDRERVRASWERCIARREPYLETQRLRRADGIYRHTEVRAVPVLEADGSVREWVGTHTDVTAAALAERGLAESRAFLEAVTLAVPSLIHVYDLQARQSVYTNDRLTGLFGHSADEIAALGQDFLARLIHPDDRARLEGWREQGRGLGEGETLEVEYRLRHKDGGYRWVRGRERVFKRREDGSAWQMLGVLEDITERREAAERLREGEARLALALESGRMGAWDWDIASGLQVWTPQMSALFGLPHPPGGLQPVERFFAAVHPEDLPRIRARAEAAAASGAEEVEDEFRVTRPDGLEVWIYSRSRLHRDAEGRLARMTGINLDATERKRAEARLRGLADSMPQIVWTAEPTGRVNYLNRRWSEYTGLGPEESLADPNLPVHPDDRAAAEAVWADSVPKGRPYEFEMRLRRRDGAYRWHLSRCVPAKDAAGRVEGWYGTSTDIHERKEVEQALRESEERFRVMAEGSPSIIWVNDPAGRVRFVNRAYREFFAVSLEALRSEGWQPLLHPDDAGAYTAAYQRAVAERGEFRAEARVRHRSGEWRWLESYASPILGAGGEFLGMVGSSPDITERKQAELDAALLAEVGADLARLAEPQAIMRAVGGRLAAYLGASRVFFVRLDTEAATSTVLFDWCAEGLRSTAGVYRLEEYGSPAFVAELTAGRAVALDDVAAHPITRDAAGRFAALGIGASLNVPYLSPGRPPFLLAAASPQARAWQPREERLLRELAERVWARLERAEAEARLRDSERRYRALFESMDQGFSVIELIYDSAGAAVDYRFVEVNPAFEREAGVRAEPGRRISEVVPGLERGWVETYAQVAESGEPLRFERQAASLGRWFEVYAVRSGGPGSRRVATLFSDITLRVTTLQALRESEERLRALVESQRRFVADASHELRAPLTSIQGNLELLQRFAGMAAEDRQAALDEAAREAVRLGRLVGDMLALARGDAGLGLRLEPTDLTEVAREALGELAPLAGERRLLAEALPQVRVSGHRDRLKQLAIILLENALKYTPPGGSVRLELRPAEAQVELRVSDTGVGISPDDLPHVFERFYRADPARRRGSPLGPDPGGTGLGLSIARQIVEAHGGTIRLESEVGRGTTAVVRLPLLGWSGAR